MLAFLFDIETEQLLLKLSLVRQQVSATDFISGRAIDHNSQDPLF